MGNQSKIELLADWLERQVGDSSITDGSIWQALSMSGRTFYRLKSKAVALMDSRLTNRRKEVEQSKLQEEITAAVTVIKTKNERILILQNHVDAIQKEITENKTTDYMILSGKMVKVVKDITVTQRAYLRRTAKELQGEISKIQGDYAPNELRQVDKNGDDVKAVPPAILIIQAPDDFEIKEHEE